MRTIHKYSGFWLKKATIMLIILVLALNMPNLLMIVGGDSLMGVNQSAPPKTMNVILTAYSSTMDQTDDTPFTTASNTRVRDGIVAANFLAFGTKVKIPSLFGDKVFTVEDRMARKNDDKMDIWFPERHLAKNFGVKEAEVVILE